MINEIRNSIKNKPLEELREELGLNETCQTGPLVSEVFGAWEKLYLDWNEIKFDRLDEPELLETDLFEGSKFMEPFFLPLSYGRNKKSSFHICRLQNRTNQL